MKQTIDIVIVTFNRVEKLRHALSCYDLQTEKFRNLIVVDNCSTDSTHQFLSLWKQETSSYGKHVVRMESNTGGAGGFYEGQRYAASMNPDWILLADDDAYPYPDTIEEFYKFVEVEDLSNVAAISSVVIDRNGSYALHHRKKRMIQYGFKYSEPCCPITEYQKKSFEIDSFSYVGIIIKANVLKKTGYDIPNYFIYFDDTEHSIRIRKFGKILCIPSIRIKHDEGFEDEHERNTHVTWRMYYLVRNSLHCLKKHYFLCSVWSTLVILKSIFINKENVNISELSLYRKEIICAIIDAWRGKLGIHYKYRPGYENK